MKTVFNGSMVAHVWAQQSQESGRNAGRSFSFEGEVLYSYATPIAAFTKAADGSPVVLMSSHRYSVTTAKHMSEARRAVRSQTQVFTVPDIGHSGGRARTLRRLAPRLPFAWAEVHRTNTEYLAEYYADTVGKCLRVQSWNWADISDVLKWLEGTASYAIGYAQTFGLQPPKLDTRADAARIWARCERLTAERNAPGADEKRERLREQRAAAKERREQRARELRALDGAAKLAKWRDGENFYGYRLPLLANGSAALRISKDGAKVQTSQGAEVPVSDAAHILRGLEIMRGNGMTEWRRPPGQVLGYNLGPFHLDAFDARGITAGCHFISWTEVEAIAPKLRAVQEG